MVTYLSMAKLSYGVRSLVSHYLKVGIEPKKGEGQLLDASKMPFLCPCGDNWSMSTLRKSSLSSTWKTCAIFWMSVMFQLKQTH